MQQSGIILMQSDIIGIIEKKLKELGSDEKIHDVLFNDVCRQGCDCEIDTKKYAGKDDYEIQDINFIDANKVAIFYSYQGIRATSSCECDLEKTIQKRIEAILQGGNLYIEKVENLPFA